MHLVCWCANVSEFGGVSGWESSAAGYYLVEQIRLFWEQIVPVLAQIILL